MDFAVNRQSIDHAPFRTGNLRFAIGRPNHQSSTWTVWTVKGEADVYAAVRAVAGEWKFSFHKSGKWRYAETSGYTGKHGVSPLLKPDDRVIQRWDRPAETGSWTHGMTVNVPYGYLNDYEQVKPHAQVVFVPEPAPGHRVAVSINIAYGSVPDLHLSLPHEFFFIGGLALGGGGAVLVCASHLRLDEQDRQMLDTFSASPRCVSYKDGLPPRRPQGLTALLFDPEAETPYVWDVLRGALEASNESGNIGLI